MWVWTRTDDDRVTDCRLQCCDDCDEQGPRDASMNLSYFAGPDGAWNGAEELLASYKWPAPQRRKLLAFLRDAARLAPNEEPRRRA